tara:strand:+ start:1878 stop:2378 length:501 start_codon:yes stop_codon:yes gene_type:complete
MNTHQFINDYSELYTLLVNVGLEVSFSKDGNNYNMYIYPHGYKELYILSESKILQSKTAFKFNSSHMIYNNHSLTKQEVYTFVIESLIEWKHIKPHTPKFLANEIDIRFSNKWRHKYRIANFKYTNNWLKIIIENHSGKDVKVDYENQWFIHPNSYVEIFKELENI